MKQTENVIDSYYVVLNGIPIKLGHSITKYQDNREYLFVSKNVLAEPEPNCI